MAETLKELAEYQNDHDVLIDLRADVRGMRSDIKRLTDATTIKTDDHEKRIRSNELAIESIKTSSKVWRFALSLAIAIGTIASTILAAIIASHRV
jgi:hypothetical protein